MDDIVLTPAPAARTSASLTWNDSGGGGGGGGGGIQPSLRTRYQEKETLDIDEPDAESLPATEAAPAGRRRKYTRRKRAPSRRRRTAGGRVGKRRKKGTKRRKGRRRRTKGYTVRKGKIRVYSSALGAPRMFSASKILSKISASTIENAANLVARSRARGRGRGGRRRKR